MPVVTASSLTLPVTASPDARAGRIVFVGEAERRVREDYLRILRFFRFFAWYGSGLPPDAAAAGGLPRPCAASLSDVVGGTCLQGDPEAAGLRPIARAAVALMARTGVLGEVHAGTPIDLDRFKGVVAIEEDQLFEVDPDAAPWRPCCPTTRWARLQFAERLRLPNAERDRIAAALAPTPAFKSWMSPREIRRALYRLGAQAFRDRAKLAWAPR